MFVEPVCGLSEEDGGGVFVLAGVVRASVCAVMAEEVQGDRFFREEFEEGFVEVDFTEN